MNINSRLQSVFAYLPPCVLEAVRSVPQCEQRQLREIRLRLARKLTVTAGDKEFFLSRSGLLTSSADNAVDVTCDDISYICRLAFKESVHSFRSEIINGYVTVKGGSRIGFCGTAVLDVRNSYSVENVKDISCVNIRIAREIKGCAPHNEPSYSRSACKRKNDSAARPYKAAGKCLQHKPYRHQKRDSCGI